MYAIFRWLAEYSYVPGGDSNDEYSGSYQCASWYDEGILEFEPPSYMPHSPIEVGGFITLPLSLSWRKESRIFLLSVQHRNRECNDDIDGICYVKDPRIYSSMSWIVSYWVVSKTPYRSGFVGRTTAASSITMPINLPSSLYRYKIKFNVCAIIFSVKTILVFHLNSVDELKLLVSLQWTSLSFNTWRKKALLTRC
jgi:hypothetical protein